MDSRLSKMSTKSRWQRCWNIVKIGKQVMNQALLGAAPEVWVGSVGQFLIALQNTALNKSWHTCERSPHCWDINGATATVFFFLLLECLRGQTWMTQSCKTDMFVLGDWTGENRDVAQSTASALSARRPALPGSFKDPHEATGLHLSKPVHTKHTTISHNHIWVKKRKKKKESGAKDMHVTSGFYRSIDRSMEDHAANTNGSSLYFYEHEKI